jgi:IS605 OrfB family transposase
VLGIDPGVSNWLTCLSNIGKSFIIDGRKVKSQNQWYNKQIANLKKDKTQGFWNEELASITERRNRQMRDAINKAARYVINWCIHNRVGTIVFGWNQHNKDSINIGKKNNQEFVQIPTARLKKRVEQLCQQYGIEFVETEESYTSKSSFLDNDVLPTYDEKLKEQYQFSGKRGQRKRGKLHNLGRGGYQTKAGIRINSDCNGAANILRKVATQLGLNLAKVGRAVLILPRRINVFSQPKGVSENILCESLSL